MNDRISMALIALPALLIGCASGRGFKEAYRVNYAIVENRSCPKLPSERIFISAATSRRELCDMVEKAGQFSGHGGGFPARFEDIEKGLETKGQYEAAFARKAGDTEGNGINNRRHYLFTYREIIGIIAACKGALANDEDRLYYVIGADTAQRVYADSSGQKRIRGETGDYALRENPSYDSDCSDRGSARAFKYYYLVPGSGEKRFVDEKSTFHKSGFIIIYDIKGKKVLSDHYDSGWN